MKNEIIIKGARANNLQNISLNIPKNKIIVITGVSGSGKSTLAYDTIYAEAQRRYIESLSSYARQFLKNHNKPEVDEIKGLSPAIAINQKKNINNARSTVGTTTEIYYYLTLLYEKMGAIFCPTNGREVKPSSFDDVKKYIQQLQLNTKFLVCCPIKQQDILRLKNEGYAKIIYKKTIINSNEITNTNTSPILIIDKLIYKQQSDFQSNLYNAYNKAVEYGQGECLIYNQNYNLIQSFDENLILDNSIFEKPHKDLFNFNNPYGACSNCRGHGELLDLDENKIIPNKELSIRDNAIHPWKNGKMEKWKNELIELSSKINFPINKKYQDFSKEEKNILWHGKQTFKGIVGFFNFIKRKSYKIQYRIMMSRYQSVSICKQCDGNRLRKESQYIKIKNHNIGKLVNLNIVDFLFFIKNIPSFNSTDTIIKKIKQEIILRSESIINLGLEHLTLNRKSSSLSGGETQKINIAKSLSSGLVGSLYILDEPSIGLHDRDTVKLIDILKKLKEIGNSIIIIEHDKKIIQSADHIIDMGPLAGSLGGKIIYSGKLQTKCQQSLTLNYINKNITIQKTNSYRKLVKHIEIKGAHANNLKNIDVKIPLNAFTAITGVSGSGKTTLLKDVLLPAIKRKLKDYNYIKPKCIDVDINLNDCENIEFLNYNSIKKYSKSIPATYINAFDSIRELFSSQNLAKNHNITAKHFSFNVKSGRCENCKGLGYVTVEMQFLSDMEMKCETCEGHRYQDDILNILFADKNISDILNLTIEENYHFFQENKQFKIAKKLQPLIKVGLGYLKLGQPVSTLSSGEAQRLKLASFLHNNNTKSILIFDEPTTGLHFHDIHILFQAFQELIQTGNTVIVIEHNLDIIKNVDWIIDLGPESGQKGGNVIFSGIPNDLIKENSYTGLALRKEF